MIPNVTAEAFRKMNLRLNIETDQALAHPLETDVETLLQRYDDIMQDYASQAVVTFLEWLYRQAVIAEARCQMPDIPA